MTPITQSCARLRLWQSLIITLMPYAPVAMAAATADDSAKVHEALAAADRFRGHLDEAIEYKVDLKCTDQENGPTERQYVVRSKGDAAAALTTSPEDHKGDLYLVNGRSIWDVKKTSKQPMAVSLTSRLTGLASVGDIVAMGFAGLYDGVNRGPDKAVDGATKYELTAKPGKAATYEAAYIWIDEKTKFAKQVQFLTVAKTPHKTVTFVYDSQLKLGAKPMAFISESKVVDAISSCTLKYYDGKKTKVDPKEFNIDQVAKARGLPSP